MSIFSRLFPSSRSDEICRIWAFWRKFHLQSVSKEINTFVLTGRTLMAADRPSLAKALVPTARIERGLRRLLPKLLRIFCFPPFLFFPKKLSMSPSCISPYRRNRLWVVFLSLDVFFFFFSFVNERRKRKGKKQNLTHRYPKTLSANWNSVFFLRKEKLEMFCASVPSFLFIFDLFQHITCLCSWISPGIFTFPTS